MDVPFPALNSYTPLVGSGSSIRTGNDQAFHDFWSRKFVQHADVFVAPVRLQDLRNRPRSQAETDAARAISASLATQAPQVLSCIIVDLDGIVLLAYLSSRVRREGPEPNFGTSMDPKSLLSRAKPLSQQYIGRTAEDIKDIPESDLVWDGLTDCARRTAEVTQTLVAVHRPVFKENDVRHYIGNTDRDPRIIEFPMPQHLEPISYEGFGKRTETIRRGKTDPKGMTAEKASVMHFAHFWHQQGTAVEDMGGPSHDMRGSSGLQIQANKHYFLADESAKIISSRFKAVYPEYHASYQRIFDAGVFLKKILAHFPPEPSYTKSKCTTTVTTRMKWVLEGRFHVLRGLAHETSVGEFVAREAVSESLHYELDIGTFITASNEVESAVEQAERRADT
ncbi:hypothetical protein B0H14DRAFT_2568328 [Mycena olivaceomarginata]|nr:hypothetical protein B0H14DRAFT_2568328 [Mycena olivaceomarginata]